MLLIKIAIETNIYTFPLASSKSFGRGIMFVCSHQCDLFETLTPHGRQGCVLPRVGHGPLHSFAVDTEALT